MLYMLCGKRSFQKKYFMNFRWRKATHAKRSAHLGRETQRPKKRRSKIQLG